MGDHTLVTCQLGEATLTVKADKAAAYEMDAPIGMTFPDHAVFLFDSDRRPHPANEETRR